MNKYGFYESNLKMKRLPHIEKERWFTTAMFSASAKNHCASVSVLNLFKVFCKQDKAKDIPTFKSVHQKIGNGPVLFLRRKLIKHFSLNTKRIFSKKDMIDAIDQNEPVLLLLKASLFDWHWVLVTGYHDYHTLEIVDNWSALGQKTYVINQHSKMIPFFSFKVIFLDIISDSK